MWLTGDNDRAPLRISFPQAYLHGGGEGAMASMVAFWARRMNGEGQHVDVSIQESIMLENLNAWGNWEISRRIIKREGAYRAFGPYRVRYVYPCKDGFVVFMLLGGHVGARGQRALVEWMDREGMANDLLRGFDWDRFDSAAYTDEMARVLEPAFGKFLLTKTKEELFAAARKMQFLLAPMNTIKEVLESPHFRERNLWVEVEHPELGTRLPYPGSPFKSSEVSWNTGRRPPLIGEHNQEIYEGELGYSKEQMSVLKGRGVI